MSVETEEEVKPKKMTKRRRRVVIEEEIEDKKDPRLYEEVRFTFWNEEQRGVPISYEWIDKYLKFGACKGMFYDGKIYSLPRIAYDYYKNLSTPIYKEVEQELVPGQIFKASKEVGRKYRFRLEEVR